jgi:3-hydroxyacyl-CoA dehydrogenase
MNGEDTRTGSAGQAVVDYEVRDAVAVLTIDNPPVNASTRAVRHGLLEGLRRAAADDQVCGIVLVGAGQHFVAGSDLTEFDDALLPEPQLPAVIEEIRSCRLPVVAAMSGATLGGGLELALACDFRVASESCVVGLPEITLGMVPGAGGTQRTLHLVGAPRTIELVTTGERHSVLTEVGRALVDEVVQGDLLEAAVKRVGPGTPKRDLLDEPVPDHPQGAVEVAARAAIAKRRGKPEVIAAVGAVLAGLALPPRAALAHERAEFHRLRTGSASAALRYGFFARQAIKRRTRPSRPVELGRVAVVGAGTMGRGIARALVEAGVRVTIHDEVAGAAEHAQATLADTHRDLGRTGVLTEAEVAERTALLEVAASVGDLAGHDLYVEAVFEDVDVKVGVLRELEEVSGQSPLATNTSYLDIDGLASALRSPDRLVGLHFFSPAHRTGVVEVVRASASSTLAVDTALATAHVLDKLPILARPGPGFIGNRIYNAYRWQCELMLEEGATPRQVDAALEAFGFAMGPFAVWDMSGLDIAWRMRRAADGVRDPDARYPAALDALCDQGRLGQKAGRGWYRYDDGPREPRVDPAVEALVRALAEEKGVEQRELTADEIRSRALLAMANEASLLLGEGVAEDPVDVDLMLVLGYGFPPSRGGIAHWVRSQDRGRLERELDALAAATGHGFRRGDLSRLDDTGARDAG